MKKFTVTKPFLDIHCGLAEGPFWEQDKNVLRFVDIVNRSVYRVDLNLGPTSLKKQQYDHSISVTAELDGDPESFIFGGKHGVGIAKKENNDHQYIQQFWTDGEKEAGMDQRMRANDGAVDSQGRFWVSALVDPQVAEFAPIGVLFRLDSDGGFHRMIEEVTIPNGMSWSKDDKTLYFTDSPTRTVFAYDYDAATGSLSNKRDFFQVKDDGTAPDGHAQDEFGNLWIAIWGAWKVVCVSPTKDITAEILLPTRCITAVAFAGEDLYITSEADPEAEKYPDSARYQGGVFKCHVGVKGRGSIAAKIKMP